jgi:hypothetical protein
MPCVKLPSILTPTQTPRSFNISSFFFSAFPVINLWKSPGPLIFKSFVTSTASIRQVICNPGFLWL